MDILKKYEYLILVISGAVVSGFDYLSANFFGIANLTVVIIVLLIYIIICSVHI